MMTDEELKARAHLAIMRAQSAGLAGRLAEAERGIREVILTGVLSGAAVSLLNTLYGLVSDLETVLDAAAYEPMMMKEVEA